MTTPLSVKAEILSDLWLNYRDEPQFVDFVAYNDLGLPLAYATSTGIVPLTDRATSFIEEAFDLLLAGLDVAEDTGFESLEDLLN